MNIFCASIKYLLFIFNLFLLILSVAILIIGSILQYNFDYHQDVFGDKVTSSTILLLSTGAFILAISYLGYRGAVTESRPLLYVYLLLLLLALGGLITGAVLAFNSVANAADDIREALIGLIGQYGSSSEATATWDKLQKWFQCCGVDSSSDWTNLHPYFPIPESCNCKTNTLGEKCEDGIYKYGCSKEVYHFFSLVEHILAGIAMAAGVLAVIMIIFTSLLTGAIRRGVTANNFHENLQ